MLSIFQKWPFSSKLWDAKSSNIFPIASTLFTFYFLYFRVSNSGNSCPPTPASTLSYENMLPGKDSIGSYISPYKPMTFFAGHFLLAPPHSLFAFHCSLGPRHWYTWMASKSSLALWHRVWFGPLRPLAKDWEKGEEWSQHSKSCRYVPARCLLSMEVTTALKVTFFTQLLPSRVW